MANELTLCGNAQLQVTTERLNYKLAPVMGGTEQTLKRNTDFGVIPKTKKPTLFKSGAEKVAKAFGCMVRYNLIDKRVELGDDPVFFYEFECKFVKINPNNGEEYVIANGFGSANTKEKRNGFNGAYDSANSSMKMAMKRSLVAAAITIGGISDMFEQDLDNETFMNNAQAIIDSTSPDAPISAKQTKRIFALAADLGLNAEQAKNKLKAAGFNSTKDVKQKDYDAVCNLFMADSAKEEPKAEPQKKTTRKKSSEA